MGWGPSALSLYQSLQRNRQFECRYRQRLFHLTIKSIAESSKMSCSLKMPGFLGLKLVLIPTCPVHIPPKQLVPTSTANISNVSFNTHACRNIFLLLRHKKICVINQAPNSVLWVCRTCPRQP